MSFKHGHLVAYAYVHALARTQTTLNQLQSRLGDVVEQAEKERQKEEAEKIRKESEARERARQSLKSEEDMRALLKQAHETQHRRLQELEQQRAEEVQQVRVHLSLSLVCVVVFRLLQTRRLDYL